MRIGHDSEWWGHLAVEKTYQRIPVSIFWPNMKSDITEYCQTCKSCEMRRRTTRWDRAPITAVIRPEQVFEVMNYDIIGPFSNKWVEAVPVKNLLA